MLTAPKSRKLLSSLRPAGFTFELERLKLPRFVCGMTKCPLQKFGPCRVACEICYEGSITRTAISPNRLPVFADHCLLEAGRTLRFDEDSKDFRLQFAKAAFQLSHSGLDIGCA